MLSLLSIRRILTALCMVTIAPSVCAVELSQLAIATPIPQSSTFESVPEVTCDTTCVNKIYKIYAKNRNLFDQCVVDGDYQIFPHTGKYPNRAQLRALVKSPACIAIFTAVLLAEIPACGLGGTPLRSAAETLLTLKVDIVDEGHKPPTSARFKDMVLWRHAVGLAQAAGVPFDGKSELFDQYARNLLIALTDTSVQVFLDYSVVFILPNGTISRGSSAQLVGSSSSRSGCGSSVGSLECQDEGNDIAVGVTVPSSPSPTPTPTSQVAFAQNQSSPDTISKQQASSAAPSAQAVSWWPLCTATIAGVGALSL